MWAGPGGVGLWVVYGTNTARSGRPLKRRAFMGVIIPSARPPAFPAARVQIKWSSDTTRPGGGPSANGKERVTPRPARARQRRFSFPSTRPRDYREVSGRLLLMGFSPSVGRSNGTIKNFLASSAGVFPQSPGRSREQRSRAIFHSAFVLLVSPSFGRRPASADFPVIALFHT